MSRRLRADYPEGVIAIYDNAGQSNETADRYTVVYEPFTFDCEEFYPVISMSAAPFHPQGVCLCNDSRSRPYGGWQAGSASAGKTITFSELPTDCQRVVLERRA